MELNEVLQDLLDIYREYRLAHAYLIETNNITKCYDEMKEFIKIISCKKTFEPNCTKCNLCNLININNLPSLITIEPDGKSIKKEAIENLKSSFANYPIYTENNIYIIKYPEKMNATAFNKMLKFLEEPENNIIGFFITEDKDDIASTIISRCETLKIFYTDINDYDKLGIEVDEYNKINVLAQTFIEKIEIGSKNIVWYNTNVLLKELPNREDIINFLKIVMNSYHNKLLSKDCFLKDNILRKEKILVKYLEQLNYNVNISLLLDSLVIEMGQINEK